MSFGKKSWLSISGLLICLSATAQKKQYTMAEATNGITTTLAPKGLRKTAWRPESHLFFYYTENGINVYDAQKKNAATDMHQEPQLMASANARTITWLTPELYFWMKNDTVVFESSRMLNDNVSRAEINERALRSGSQNIHVHDNHKQVVFTRDNNLFLSRENEQVVAVTSDNNPDIINGQAVHRNEFGITEGIFISPKGNAIAYYRMDQTMVADYPVINWSQVPAKNENVKYPMAGGKSHEVTVRVYNPETKQTIELQTGEHKDHYLTCVTWSPDEKYIYVAILNRGQNHLWLNQYSAKTGKKLQTIFEETDPKYVEPQHALTFLPGSNDRFVWWSQRDGYMHLYLCDLATNKMRCLTQGRYVVNELLGFNARRREVLFTSAKEDPREKHGYAVNWETGTMRRLDSEPGTHNFIASDDGEYLYDVLTAGPTFEHEEMHNGGKIRAIVAGTPAVAKKSMIRSVDGQVVKVLLDAPNPLADYDRPEIRNVALNANDGTPLYGKLILPVNFDPSKKYPVIVYLYNGPHVQLVKNGFPESGNLWYEYLAQHGYVVWTMDGRGSSNRGLKFEQAIFRKLGTLEMDDHLVGVNYLKSLPFVDGKRLGIHGWSYGGFMTTSMMLRHPGVFKCAVAGGPVIDWSMYEIMYGERYMDTPQENPKGYADANLLTKVKNLKGKLLMIHGAQDATVVWQHSINFIKKSVDENVQVDYFVYPGYEHNVRGKDRVHLMQKITDYFDQNL